MFNFQSAMLQKEFQTFYCSSLNTYNNPVSRICEINLEFCDKVRNFLLSFHTEQLSYSTLTYPFFPPSPTHPFISYPPLHLLPFLSSPTHPFLNFVYLIQELSFCHNPHFNKNRVPIKLFFQNLVSFLNKYSQKYYLVLHYHIKCSA